MACNACGFHSMRSSRCRGNPSLSSWSKCWDRCGERSRWSPQRVVDRGARKLRKKLLKRKNRERVQAFFDWLEHSFGDSSSYGTFKQTSLTVPSTEDTFNKELGAEQMSKEEARDILLALSILNAARCKLKATAKSIPYKRLVESIRQELAKGRGDGLSDKLWQDMLRHAFGDVLSTLDSDEMTKLVRAFATYIDRDVYELGDFSRKLYGASEASDELLFDRTSQEFEEWDRKLRELDSPQ